jgi:hypothetical protein
LYFVFLFFSVASKKKMLRLQLAACSLQLAACSLQLAACSLQLAARNKININ